MGHPRLTFGGGIHARWSLALSFSILLFAGCTYTVHPLLMEENLADRHDLAGIWQTPPEAGKPGSPRFQLEGFGRPRRYRMTVSGAEVVAAEANAEYELWVGQLGEHLFGQVRRLPGDGPQQPLLSGIPVYALFRIEVEGDLVRIYHLNDSAVSAWLHRNQYPHLKYRPGESDLPEFSIVTVPTADLQTLVKTHVDEFFNAEPAVLQRIEAADQ